MYLYTQCNVYLPTCGLLFMVNVGKYLYHTLSVRGSDGLLYL